MLSLISRARTIAINNLRACYSSSGILAGQHHFTDYWARDGFFAAFGSMSIGDFEIVEKMAETFFSFQRQDGLIPYRIMTGPVTIGKYFGSGKKWAILKPTYKLRGYGPEVLDGKKSC